MQGCSFNLKLVNICPQRGHLTAVIIRRRLSAPLRPATAADSDVNLLARPEACAALPPLDCTDRFFSGGILAKPLLELGILATLHLLLFSFTKEDNVQFLRNFFTRQHCALCFCYAIHIVCYVCL